MFALGTAAAHLAGCTRQEPAALDVRRVFVAEFDSALADVRNLRGGGSVTAGHDLWLRFDTRRPVRLKPHGISRAPAPQEIPALVDFAGPCAPLLARGERSVVLLAHDPHSDFPNGALFVSDPSSGEHCPRSRENR